MKITKTLSALLAIILGVLVSGQVSAQTPSTQCVSSAIAGGTADAITIPPLPCSSTTNLLILTAAAANDSTTVTLQVGSAAPLPILRNSGDAIQVGDIPEAGYRAVLTPTGSSWLLLNPLNFSGQVACGQLPGLIGDVISIAGTCSTTVSATGKQSAGFNGNNLVNFFNPQLTHGSAPHKAEFVIGDSTVWNATNYYIDQCNAYSSQNILSNVGMTPCTSTISGYEVTDNIGTIKITFSGTTPSGYSVGDLVLSQPNNAALNTLIGTGVITNVGTSTITYTLLSINPLPVITAFTSSGGIITNSLLNMGYNGATSTAILATVVPLLQTYARPGDLVLMRAPLINNVRNGGCDLTCATAAITALYNGLVAALPLTTDIAVKTENSLLLSDPTASGLVTFTNPPYATLAIASAAYTKIIHDAVFQAFATIANRAVVWDNMQVVFSKLGQEYTTSSWMTDILHPNTIGQTRESLSDTGILISIGSGRGLPVTSPSNNYLNTATNGNGAGFLNGDPEATLANFRSRVGFSQFLEEHAMINSYGSPWTLYRDAVLDTENYDIVAYGSTGASGATFVRFSQPTVNGSSPLEVKANDLIWLAGVGVFQVPAGFSQSTFNIGSTVFNYQLGSLGSIIPAAGQISGLPIAVMRQHTYSLVDVAGYKNKTTYPYRHRLIASAGGTNTITIQYQDATPSWPTGISTTDTIYLPCGSIPLSSATFAKSGALTQISTTGSFAACNSQTGWIFGTHPIESNFSLMNSTLGPSDSITQNFQTITAGGNSSLGYGIRQTTTAITTAKTIATIPEDGADLTVCGSDGTNTFCDKIMAFLTTTAPIVVKTGDGAGSPAARTYTISGTGNVQLAMASGTYSVVAQGLVTGQR